jgi:uncharacterized membrane protein YpjA
LRVRSDVAGVNPLPERVAREYLEGTATLVLLLVLTTALTLVGFRFYVDRGLASVSTFLWPLFADSPVATALATASFLTLLPNLGRRLERAPTNAPLVYLHTFAFVWLVKFGLWTAVALNLGFSAYFPDLYGYWGVMLSHLGFVGLALLVPHYSHTTRGALAFALVVSLVNDVVDYGFGLHPPLRYEAGPALAVATFALTFLTVGLASVVFELTAENDD